MKDAYYFPHDSNAQYDEKISLLRLEHGWFGYGIYWAVIEKLRDATNYQWSIMAEAGLKHGLSDAQTSLEHISAVLETLKKVGLLTVSEDGLYLYSKSLISRMERIDERRKKLSEAGKTGAKSRLLATLKPCSSDVQARLKPPLSYQIKSKQIKTDQNKSIKDIHLDCVLLSKDEFSKLTESFGIEGTNERIKNLNDYVMSKGAKYKSHYHTILNWERKNGTNRPVFVNKAQVLMDQNIQAGKEAMAFLRTKYDESGKLRNPDSDNLIL